MSKTSHRHETYNCDAKPVGLLLFVGYFLQPLHLSSYLGHHKMPDKHAIQYLVFFPSRLSTYTIICLTLANIEKKMSVIVEVVWNLFISKPWWWDTVWLCNLKTNCVLCQPHDGDNAEKKVVSWTNACDCLASLQSSGSALFCDVWVHE